MGLIKRYSSTIAIVLVLFVINIVAVRWHSLPFLTTRSSTLLRYGDHLPRLKGRSLVGSRVTEPATNRTNLILYFPSTPAMPGGSIELVKYAEILSQHYGKGGLSVFAIVQEDTPALRNLIEHSLINYDVVVDQGQQLGEKLGLGPGENGVFLFDHQGLCRFSTRRPVKAEDLRQLVAMEFLHVDPFENPTAEQQVIQKGKPLGSWSLVDVRSWEQTSLDKIRLSNPKLFVFFTADCSVCSLPEYLEEFAKFEHRQQSEGGDGKSTVLIFDFNFSPIDVLDQLKTHGINAPAYIANEELTAVAEISHTDSSEDKRVITVQTDEQGRVLNISSLTSLTGVRDDPAISATEDHTVRADTVQPIYEEMFRDIPLTAYDVAAHDSRYFVTDFKSNRVLVIKDNAEVEREFGRIGSGPGRLFHPGCIDVARDGTIYVEDGGNERVVKFTSDGRYLGEFRITNHEGFAVGTHKEIYLGQPEEGHLITVYSGSGQKLRAFGQLKKFSDLYGAAFADKDTPYKVALNRIRLSTDGDGNLYISFMLTPLIQKYSSDGNLLFERRLEDPEIDRLMQAIREKKYIATTRDAADARIVALDPVVEPATGNILVPLVDGSIYVADRDGRKLTLLRPQVLQQPNQAFYPFIAGLGANGELLVTPFPPKHWYRLTLPATSVEEVTRLRR